jgi:hypothetical protein
MRDWSYEELIAAGYDIENAEITDVSLNMNEHDCLVLCMALNGNKWGCLYGGYKLGQGHLGADKFIGSKDGLEAIMRIMDVVGVSDLTDMEGKYVRVATRGLGLSVKIIGNIIIDRWFDYGTFFEKKEMEEPVDESTRFKTT